MSEFVLEPPTDREYTTDEEGCKRVGYVPGESEVEIGFQAFALCSGRRQGEGEG